MVWQLYIGSYVTRMEHEEVEPRIKNEFKVAKGIWCEFLVLYIMDMIPVTKIASNWCQASINKMMG